MKQIHQKALDVGSIQILIRHDHDASIAKILRRRILAALLQADNLLNRSEFLVLIELELTDILYIQHLTLERENAPSLTADNLET